MPVRRSPSKKATQEPGILFRIRQIRQVIQVTQKIQIIQIRLEMWRKVEQTMQLRETELQVMDRQQMFHRRQNAVPVTEPESARNARVVQHLVSVVEDPCGRPAVPAEAVADRPVPDVAAAVWMLPAEPAAGIVEAVAEIPASSAVEAVVSLAVSVMVRV